MNKSDTPTRRPPGLSRTTLALAAWIAVILMVGILPLRNFVGHSHWEFIQWTIPPGEWRSLRFQFDVVANMGLFYPLGLLLAQRLPLTVGKRALLVIGTGLLLSAGIEFFQVYCHNRHPSPYDIMSNAAGTALGLWTAARVFSFRHMEALLPAPHSHPTGS